MIRKSYWIGLIHLSALLAASLTLPANADSSLPASTGQAESLDQASSLSRSTRPERGRRGETERPVSPAAEPSPLSDESPSRTPGSSMQAPSSSAPAEAGGSSTAAPQGGTAVTPIPLPADTGERADRLRRMVDRQRAAEETERTRRDARYKELFEQQADSVRKDNERRESWLRSGDQPSR